MTAFSLSSQPSFSSSRPALHFPFSCTFCLPLMPWPPTFALRKVTLRERCAKECQESQQLAAGAKEKANWPLGALPTFSIFLLSLSSFNSSRECVKILACSFFVSYITSIICNYDFLSYTKLFMCKGLQLSLLLPILLKTVKILKILSCFLPFFFFVYFFPRSLSSFPSLSLHLSDFPPPNPSDENHPASLAPQGDTPSAR